MDIIDYGVCRLALVPVRNEPRDGAEQTTQLLFGDHYEVVSVAGDKKWLSIRIITDQCEGWIDSKEDSVGLQSITLFSNKRTNMNK